MADKHTIEQLEAMLEGHDENQPIEILPNGEVVEREGWKDREVEILTKRRDLGGTY